MAQNEELNYLLTLIPPEEVELYLLTLIPPELICNVKVKG